jgi:hypothetical protein
MKMFQKMMFAENYFYLKLARQIFFLSMSLFSANSFAGVYEELVARCVYDKSVLQNKNGFDHISIQQRKGTDQILLVRIADDGFVDVILGRQLNVEKHLAPTGDHLPNGAIGTVSDMKFALEDGQSAVVSKWKPGQNGDRLVYNGSIYSCELGN